MQTVYTVSIKSRDGLLSRKESIFLKNFKCKSYRIFPGLSDGDLDHELEGQMRSNSIFKWKPIFL